MIVLIESSAEFPSVSVCDEQGFLLWDEVGVDRQSHAEKLPMMVQRAVDFARAEGKEIAAVAFQEGPGSYTGLRIGVSLAKGLCFGLSVPLISVSGFVSLAMVALEKHPTCSEAWVMMDARRDEVYALQVMREGGAVGRVKPEILPSERVVGYGSHTVFAGNANEKVKRLLLAEDSVFWDESPRASHMLGMAAESFQRGEFVDLAYYEPFYLKDFVAGVSKKFSL
jgi:tRNA threonylcarbamoyladenosine biosynthesis protein TsaB